MPGSQQGSLETRRDVLLVLAAGVAAGATGSATAQTPPRRETADLIVGPFYPQRKPREADADLTRVAGHRERAAGQIVRLTGRLFNTRGEPLAGRRIEIWQANAAGRYAHPSDTNASAPLDPAFQGYAAVMTDRDGRYALTTVKPGAYPTPRGDMRAPHIHFEVHGRTDRKTTQMFFPGEALNAQDRHLNSVRRPDTLIATVAPGPAGGLLLATWDMVLANG